jgi:hypothetical protein
MSYLISRIDAKLNDFIRTIHIRQFLPLFLVAFLLLPIHIGSVNNNKTIVKKLDEVVHQDDSQRPKTTGEWNQEAREVKGEPGERLKRIGKQSAEAVKEFGQIYPDTAEKSVSELKNSNN